MTKTSDQQGENRNLTYLQFFAALADAARDTSGPMGKTLGFIELMMRSFVMPAVQQRQAEESAPAPVPLHVAQIILSPDRPEAQVRLNDAAHVDATVIIRGATVARTGSAIFDDDVERIESVSLSSGDSPDCAHVTIVFFRDQMLVDYCVRYNEDLTIRHVRAAKEFLQTAEYADEQGFQGPFVESLFSAAELSAKAAILAEGAKSALRGRVSHVFVLDQFGAVATKGSAEREHVEALTRLRKMRLGTRYLVGEDVDLDPVMRRELLNTVRAMYEVAHGK
jgi:hypothetical protein